VTAFAELQTRALDCLRLVVVPADRRGVDVGRAFAETMDELEARLA
jgi:hypothetical protein